MEDRTDIIEFVGTQILCVEEKATLRMKNVEIKFLGKNFQVNATFNAFKRWNISFSDILDDITIPKIEENEILEVKEIRKLTRGQNQKSPNNVKPDTYFYFGIGCSLVSIVVLITTGILITCWFRKKYQTFKVNEVSAPQPLPRLKEKKDASLDEIISFPLSREEKSRITKTFSMRKNKKTVMV